MVISTAVGTVLPFFTIIQCRPVAYYWNRLSTEGRCLDTKILFGIVYMYSGVAAACDFNPGSLPIFMVWRLQMNRGTKICCVGNSGNCLHVRMLCLLSHFRAYADQRRS
jgi:hypothetical protein